MATAETPSFPVNFMDTIPYYLELSDKPLRFETISKTTEVFVDEVNSQVFTVFSGEVTEFIVQSLLPTHCLKFQIKDKGSVISMKFSPDMKYLVIQQTTNTLKFIIFENGKPANEFFQSAKKKHASILGLQWISPSEIVFVTDQSVEFYQVDSQKMTLKTLQSISMSSNWYVYCPATSLMVLSSGPTGNSMQPLLFKAGNVIKLSKFEIETSGVKQNKLMFQQRDVALAMLYKQQRILVMSHNSRDSPNHAGAIVLVYTIFHKSNKTTEIRKTHVLSLNRTGSFAMNVVDNLVAVHHQASMTSLLFDILMNQEEAEGVAFCKPVSALSIKPYTVSQSGEKHQWELYSETWITFQPNIIIDVKLGCFWHLKLCLESFEALIFDKCSLISFLLRRSDSKDVIMSVIKSIVLGGSHNLKIISEIFDLINTPSWKQSERPQSNQIGPSVSLISSPTSPAPVVDQICISQIDIYKNILTSLVNHAQNEDNAIKCKRKNKYVIWVLLEYVKSLTHHDKPIQYFLFELIINFLVQNKEYCQLYLLLQYNVVADSKPLACLLLSLENLVPSAHQLALDMLFRKSAEDEITEVLLSKQQVIPALRYLSSCGSTDLISSRKFLEAAKQSSDKKLYHSVQNWFKGRQARMEIIHPAEELPVCEVTIEF